VLAAVFQLAHCVGEAEFLDRGRIESDWAEHQVATTVDFDGSPRAVRMVLTFDAMHDDRWTDLAVRGWESELGRLERLLQGRPAPR